MMHITASYLQVKYKNYNFKLMKSYEKSSKYKIYFEVSVMCLLFFVKQTKFTFSICASVILSSSVDDSMLHK